MDCSPPVVAGDGLLYWSTRHSMDSDEGQAMSLNQAPRCMDSAFALYTPFHAATRHSHMDRRGQLSPISTGVDMMAADGVCDTNCPASATAPATSHSASSSSCGADTWSNRFGDSDDHSASESVHDGDAHWEQGSDDILTLPKPEPMDDDDYLCMDELKQAPPAPVLGSNAAPPGIAKVKRPRGRPRKHPLAPECAANKVTKGRSKTGCITCRKRKKKCDEAKPRCMNCEKNAVVCEGYPEKQIWRSGKERAEEARSQSAIPAITMQPIFDGLETLEDRIFWKHYNDHLSTALTVESEHRNAFKEILIPIATRDQGLMHSILSLSSIHLDYETPYGLNLLKKHPKTSITALRERSNFHHARAMEELGKRNPRSSDLSLSAMYGQMLCLILESVAEGRSDSQHRLHLGMYRNLIGESPPQDPAFRAFIVEFFQYHIFADELLRHRSECSAPQIPEDSSPSPPAEPPEPQRLLGVVDGLFGHLCQITSIRKRIRDKMAAQADTFVDYPSLYKAEEINQAILDWEPSWPRGDSRERVAPLYKQMMWVYLYRTIYPPSTSPSSPASSVGSVVAPSTTSAPALLPSGTTNNFEINVAPGAGSTTLVNTPPKSTSSSCSPSPRPEQNTAAVWPRAPGVAIPLTSRQQSITYQATSIGHAAPSAAPLPFSPSFCGNAAISQLNHTGSSPSSNNPIRPRDQFQSHPQALHEEELRADSPPPFRRPCQQDPRVTLAVEQSLMIIDSLKPGDPAQTLLLIPCLVVGAACFAPAQQERVRAAVRTVRGYTGLRNADRVLELLEEVWRLMAAGDWLAVWDWEGVASRMGLDFLCA